MVGIALEDGLVDAHCLVQAALHKGLLGLVQLGAHRAVRVAPAPVLAEAEDAPSQAGDGHDDDKDEELAAQDVLLSARDKGGVLWSQGGPLA